MDKHRIDLITSVVRLLDVTIGLLASIITICAARA